MSEKSVLEPRCFNGEQTQILSFIKYAVLCELPRGKTNNVVSEQV